MDVSRKFLLHADRRTTTSDVSGERKQVLHRDEVAFLVARHLGCHFQVDFMLARDDAHKVPRLFAMQHQCLEYLLNVLAQAFCHMRSAQVVLIHFVRDELVFHLRLVEQACHIGFVYFFFHIFCFLRHGLHGFHGTRPLVV